MVQALDILASASLAPHERRTVEHLVERLREEMGADLLAVWLYGSRARGEPPHDESDIDMLAIAEGGHERYDSMWVVKLIHQVADAEGVSPAWYSLFVWSPQWLRQRREIRSFFIQEVDRDRLVLCGSGLE